MHNFHVHFCSVIRKYLLAFKLWYSWTVKSIVNQQHEEILNKTKTRKKKKLYTKLIQQIAINNLC